jgi:hypothetical protein
MIENIDDSIRADCPLLRHITKEHSELIPKETKNITIEAIESEVR